VVGPRAEQIGSAQAANAHDVFMIASAPDETPRSVRGRTGNAAGTKGKEVRSLGTTNDQVGMKPNAAG
jgi:hypothetical protein